MAPISRYAPEKSKIQKKIFSVFRRLQCFPMHLMKNYVIVREIYELFAIAAVVVVLYLS